MKNPENKPDNKAASKAPAKPAEPNQKAGEVTSTVFSGKPSAFRMPQVARENHQSRSLKNHSLRSVDELKARWKEQVTAACMVWNKLSEKELLESEGHKMPLVCLIQARHDITRDEANKQVNRFFEQHMS